MLEDAEHDIRAFYAFPSSHWRKLRSTNPLERCKREVGRRTDVVGIFPDDRSLIRLAGMLCTSGSVGRGDFSSESISLPHGTGAVIYPGDRGGNSRAAGRLGPPRLTDDHRADERAGPAQSYTGSRREKRVEDDQRDSRDQREPGHPARVPA
jgi:hypothetical protein